MASQPRAAAHPSGLRFPIEHFDAFLCQCVPRWDCNDVLTQKAYDSLVQRMETGAILLTHSQGGNFGLTAAANHPDRVRAVVSLGPSGAPDPSLHDAAKLRSVPHLFVWGDFLEKHTFWVHSRPAVERWRDSLRSGGCDVTWIELPSLGIHGNSHALMSDDNGDAVAAIVLDWLREQGLSCSCCTLTVERRPQDDDFVGELTEWRSLCGGRGAPQIPRLRSG
jgi:hypothetical protein